MELAPSGIRTVCVRSTGLPETETITVSFGLHARALGMSRQQLQGIIESKTHTKRLATLAQVANALVFAASDQSSGMTGAVVNLTGGMISDWAKLQKLITLLRDIKVMKDIEDKIESEVEEEQLEITNGIF